MALQLFDSGVIIICVLPKVVDRLLTEYTILHLHYYVNIHQGLDASITKPNRGNNRKQTYNMLPPQSGITF